MHVTHAHLLLAVFGAVGLVVVLREVWRRFRVSYEYRWDSFAIRGLQGRQLFQIRQSEIQSVERMGVLAALFARTAVRRFARTSFAPKVVIRAQMMRTPVIISWEGQPIAGLTPRGLRVRSRPARGKR